MKSIYSTRVAVIVGVILLILSFKLSFDQSTIVNAQQTEISNTTGVKPPPLYMASMAFDSNRDKIVLFGGCLGDCRNSANITNETWEFDGKDWAKITTPNSPSPRFLAGIVYDVQRGVTVLFGGKGFNDTWEYDGSDWTQITTLNSPPARISANLAYDSDRHVVVLGSGQQSNYCSGGSHFTDIWEYNGVNWTQRVPAGGPTAELPSLAYDPVRQNVVQFVGRYNCNLLNQTWIYNGQSIYQFTPLVSPPQTSGPITFDQKLGKIVLFGGCSGSFWTRCTNYSNDLWTFDGLTFRLQVKGKEE